MKIFEKGLLRRLLGLKGDELTCGLEKLCDS
jgi:hypothetical protein